jgi:hypothetical protein
LRPTRCDSPHRQPSQAGRKDIKAAREVTVARVISLSDDQLDEVVGGTPGWTTFDPKTVYTSVKMETGRIITDNDAVSPWKPWQISRLLS